MKKKNYKEFEYYYKQGLNDLEIGEKLNCSYATVCLWRQRNNYLSINQLKKNRILTLFVNGYSKKEIVKLDIFSPKYTMHILRNKIDINKFDVVSYEQKCAIIGTLLGDSWINNQNTFGFGHKIGHIEYAKIKADMIDLSCKESKREQIRNKTLCKSVTITFHSHPYFKELREIFYPKNKKTFPTTFIKEYLSWKTLAYWYLDDGNNLSGKRGCCISMFNFKAQSKEIRDLLEEIFNIKFTIQNSGNILYIPYKYKKFFFDNIKEFTPMCMQYKLCPH